MPYAYALCYLPKRLVVYTQKDSNFVSTFPIHDIWWKSRAIKFLGVCLYKNAGRFHMLQLPAVHSGQINVFWEECINQSGILLGWRVHALGQVDSSTWTSDRAAPGQVYQISIFSEWHLHKWHMAALSQVVSRTVNEHTCGKQTNPLK